MTQVDLITGFLGAGKTTFIKRYGNYLKRKSIRFAVIENEFGAPEIDSAILKAEFGDIHEISGGCICCTLKAGFHQLLKELSGHFERIIVEPSGIFNADEFFDVLNSPDLSDKCQAGMFITLVDPHSVDKLHAGEASVLAAELANTGCIVWTKVDVEPFSDLEMAKRQIRQILRVIEIQDDPLYYPTPAHLLSDENFEILMEAVPVFREHLRTFEDHSRLFQSTQVYLDRVFSIEEIEACVAELTSNPEFGEISRIKGFVKSKDGVISVNCTVSDRLFELCAGGIARLNIIGRKLNRKRIKEVLMTSPF